MSGLIVEIPRDDFASGSPESLACDNGFTLAVLTIAICPGREVFMAYVRRRGSQSSERFFSPKELLVRARQANVLRSGRRAL